jgi:hypothetical protein
LFDGNGSFVHAYSKYRRQNGEDVTLQWRYMKDPIKFSDLTYEDVLTYIHNSLLELGVDVRPEVLEQWVNDAMEQNKSISTQMDALYAILSDQNSKHRP